MSAPSALSPPAALAPPSGLDWRRAASYGVLWGVGRMALESFSLPLADMSPADLLLFEAHLLPEWCLEGLVLAGATMWLEPRLILMLMAPAVVALGMLVATLGLVLRQFLFLPSWLNDQSHLHFFWVHVFYGGLFVAAYRLSAQSERTRGLLVQAEIARQRTEAFLSSARLQARQGHVDPAFLLRVMVEVERRYAQDAASVDRLLGPLVNFLRAAMPGVRSGASTLAAEVLLAGQYARVWAELEPSRATWNIKVEGAMPDLRFPPLLLLPVLDQLAADVPARHAALRVSHADGRCTLSLARPQSCRKPWLAADLSYRLQVGLRTVFGDDWALAVTDGSASPALLLTLPLERPGSAA